MKSAAQLLQHQPFGGLTVFGAKKCREDKAYVLIIGVDMIGKICQKSK